MPNKEQPYLQQCLYLIEQKTGWGNHVHWTHQDFVCLSEWILQATGVSLSSTTLKRIWGKVAYHSFPHITTLNTLANYAGYPNWRAFVAAQNAQASQQIPQQAAKPTPALAIMPHVVAHDRRDRMHIARATGIMLLFITGTLVLLSAIFSTYHTSKERSAATEAYTFSAHPVTTGVPNTVIFQYDSSTEDAGSLSIQSSGDQTQLVAADGHRHTALYYYPGVYQTRLLAGRQVVKTQEVLIDTHGWLALVERDPVPLYIKENIRQQGSLGIPVEMLASYFPNMQTATPWVDYYNVGHFGKLQSNNFTLETELKSDFNQGDAVCQDTSIVILRHHAPPITIPLAITGCLASADQALKFGVFQYDRLNLPAFGFDAGWVQVKCEAKDSRFKLWINQQLAYDGTLPAATSQIAGIVYRFHGTGRINYLHLGTADGAVVYAEDFEG